MKNLGNSCYVCLLMLYAASVAAQTTTSSYDEVSKMIRAPHATITLGDKLFGDSVNLYNGSLEFVQVDVSLPGNNALPVSVGRRLQAGVRSSASRPFGKWDMEIPHLHGMFSNKDGWAASGGNKRLRCSEFGAPPAVTGTNNVGVWDPQEFWQGSFLYIPGQGDQQLLRRNPANNVVPGQATALYPIVTAASWSLKCISNLANDPAGTKGEAFIAVSPDGTSYRFDQIIDYPALQLTRAANSGDFAKVPSDQAVAARGEVELAPNAIAGKELLQRKEVWLLPTQVTDRFGNTVTYTYDVNNPANLTLISASDGRQISLSYEAAAGKTNLVTSVFDGSRRWNYGYHLAEYWNLDSVVLPDSSSWSFADTEGLFNDVIFISTESSCESPSVLNGIMRSGTMVHPSGATGAFTLTPTTHGRSNVQKLCTMRPDGSTFAHIPRYFYTNSLTSKTIAGPGLQPLTWTNNYGPINQSWAPCGDGCPLSKYVSVTNPDQSVTRYVFGNAYDVTEGKLQEVDDGWDGTTALRSKAIRYRPAGAGPYITTAGYAGFESTGDSDLLARFTPVDQVVISQQGGNFSWQVNAFDGTLPRPTNVTKSSTLGYSRTEQTQFFDLLNPFAIGQIASVTNVDTGKVVRSNTYNGTTGLLEGVADFGLTTRTAGYNGDGTLAWERDGLGNTTGFANYTRGTPQNITNADGTSQSAVVNNDGTLASVTQDQLHLTTRLDYDAMGRLWHIYYPAGPGDAPWNATTVSFAQINMDELGIAAGHWRQDVSTGTATASTYFDALWRPVYVAIRDTSNPSGSQSVVRSTFDHAGRPHSLRIRVVIFPRKRTPVPFIRMRAHWVLGYQPVTTRWAGRPAP